MILNTVGHWIFYSARHSTLHYEEAEFSIVSTYLNTSIKPSALEFTYSREKTSNSIGSYRGVLLYLSSSILFPFQTFRLISVILKTIKIATNYEDFVLDRFHDYLVIAVNTLNSFNSATNFIIYVICGTEFRTTCLQLFYIRRW